MKIIEDRPWLSSMMEEGESSKFRTVIGICAHCQKSVHELITLLDDAYAVYRGICPHCGAVNLLRDNDQAYDRQRMYLVLPTREEVEINGWADVLFIQGEG